MMEWKPYARRLADELRACGDLTTPEWYAALEQTPRHVLVPTVYGPHSDGSLSATPLDSSENLDLVYSAVTLVTTAMPNHHGSLVPVSSSTKPDLMIRMLESLDIYDGHRVLEIGTGTGYNAALLAARLGDDNVFSVDVDSDLVEMASHRLAAVGHRPHLTARDGSEGWPEHAPYDRIIVTCAVRRIPWNWYRQLAPGGLLLVDYKPRGGNLILLRKSADRLEGRFAARYAAFMLMRGHDHSADVATRRWRSALPFDRERTTTTPAELPVVVGFLRSITTTIEISRRPTSPTPTGQPTTIRLTAPDGSCCEVDIAESADGTRTVREGGPTPVWEHIERTYHRWKSWGEPGWDRIGVTIERHSTRIWVDSPTKVVRHCSTPM